MNVKGFASPPFLIHSVLHKVSEKDCGISSILFRHIRIVLCIVLRIKYERVVGSIGTIIERAILMVISISSTSVGTGIVVRTILIISVAVIAVMASLPGLCCDQ